MECASVGVTVGEECDALLGAYVSTWVAGRYHRHEFLTFGGWHGLVEDGRIDGDEAVSYVVGRIRSVLYLNP